MITVSVENWSPAKASDALTRNPRNRKLSVKHVARIASDMGAGLYKMNGQAVVITSSGNLADGQHRLMGVVESGVTVPFVTVRGVDDDSFDTIDTGLSRNAATVLSLSGLENANVASAAARIILAYRRCGGEITSSSAIDRITTAQIVEFANNEPVRELAAWADALRRTQQAPATLIAAATWMIEDSGGQCREWFQTVASGIGLRPNTTAHTLFRYLRDLRASSTDERKNAVACIVKAWIAERDGRAMLLLRHRVGDTWPALTPSREMTCA